MELCSYLVDRGVYMNKYIVLVPVGASEVGETLYSLNMCTSESAVGALVSKLVYEGHDPQCIPVYEAGVQGSAVDFL